MFLPYLMCLLFQTISTDIAPTNVRVLVNASKTLHCPVQESSKKVSYAWVFKSKDSWKHFPKKRRHHLLNDGKLLLFSIVTENDITDINNEGGLYCMSYQGDNAKFLSKFLFKQVNKGSITPNIKPKIDFGIKANGKVVEGTNLTMHCAGIGNPLPSVKWYKDDVEIPLNEPKKYYFDPDCAGKLTLQKVTKDMEGIYKCVLANNVGSDISEAKVTVGELPKLISSFQSKIRIANGSEFSLVCNATGDEAFNYLWYRNGKQLSSYSRANYTMTVVENVLKISTVGYEDAGIYQCLVRNKYGSVSTSTEVTVEDPRSILENIDKEEELEKNSTSSTRSDFNNSNNSDGLELKYIVVIIGCTCLLVFLVIGIILFCRIRKNKVRKAHAKDADEKLQSPLHKDKHSEEYNAAPIYEFPTLPGNGATAKTSRKESPHLYFEIGNDGRSHLTSQNEETL